MKNALCLSKSAFSNCALYVISYIYKTIPGGQFVHPSAPLVEELENVPRGHGNNVAVDGSLSPGIRLNPEANRASNKRWPPSRYSSTWIASVSELIGLLEESNSYGILEHYLCKLPSTSCSIVSELSWTLPSQRLLLYMSILRDQLLLPIQTVCLVSPPHHLQNETWRVYRTCKMFLLTYVTRHYSVIWPGNYDISFPTRDHPLLFPNSHHLGSAILDFLIGRHWAVTLSRLPCLLHLLVANSRGR